MIGQLKHYLEIRKTVASDPRAHDIYVVEFPKSGITWLCTLLANMALQAAGSGQRVTHYNVQQYIPDIHMVGRMPIGDSMLSAIPQRLIKSHSFYNRYYQGIIYLARHPAAVMKSYCSYLNQQAGKSITAEQLLTHPDLGIPAWKRHVRGWLEVHDRPNRLHLVRYEDLVADAGSVLQELSDNIGWPFSAETIQHAVELSAAEHMKNSEASYRSNDPGYSMKFVKNGTPELPKEIQAAINELCTDELLLLGYTQ
jgi:hypothetical protein